MPRSSSPARRVLWQKRMDRFRRSQLSVTEFCRREQISMPSFYQWRKKLAANQPPPVQPDEARFVPVVLSDSLGQKPATLRLPGGASIELPASLGREQLIELLAACMAAGAETPQ